jgi:hypothetical protein
VPPEIDLIAKLIAGGGGLTLAVLVWLDLRGARREQREDRLDIIQLFGQQNAILNRIDERTAHLAGELTPVDVPRPVRRERTNPRGVPVPTEYSYGRTGRKPSRDDG